MRYTDFDNRWHLYWKRKTGKWWPYIPKKSVYTIENYIREVEADAEPSTKTIQAKRQIFSGGKICLFDNKEQEFYGELAGLQNMSKKQISV